MKEFFKDEPLIFANLGGAPNFPKGTLLCYREGVRLGADALCVNVQMSKDGVVMAVPSKQIDDYCDGTGYVSDFTVNELKGFDAGFHHLDDNGNYSFRGKGLTFLTLEELLLAFSDEKFNVTLMDNDKRFVKAYCDVIKKNNAHKKVLTSSMYGKAIKLVRKELPESATAFSFIGIIGIYALFKSGLLPFIKKFHADVLETPESIGVSYIANRGLVKEMNSKGIKVYVWNVSSEAEMKRIYNAEVNGYMSDDVSIIREYLNKI